MTFPEIYLPSATVTNSTLSEITGKEEGWFEKRTGIVERRRASSKETTASLGIKAVEKIKDKLNGIDLIIAATCTPCDTVGAIGYRIQKHFNIENAKVLNISTACSSMLNAVELAQQFLITESASKVLVICAEMNSYYSCDSDIMGGHLWGDAAGAFIMSYEAEGSRLVTCFSEGLGHIGEGPNGVYLQPKGTGMTMNKGRDVFYYACNYMKYACEKVLTTSSLTIEDIDYIIPHQANQRIIDRLIEDMDLPREKVISCIRNIGNTGSASTLVAMSLNRDAFKSGDKILFTVFGGGYSTGSMIVELN